jgi:hypothetical protein
MEKKGSCYRCGAYPLFCRTSINLVHARFGGITDCDFSAVPLLSDDSDRPTPDPMLSDVTLAQTYADVEYEFI